LTEVIDGVRPPAEPEADQLRADHCEQRAGDQRVDVEAVTDDRDVAEHEPHHERTEAEEQEAGQNEQESRVVDEHQTKMAPAVAERGELRLAAARMKRDRQLTDLELRL